VQALIQRRKPALQVERSKKLHSHTPLSYELYPRSCTKWRKLVVTFTQTDSTKKLCSLLGPWMCAPCTARTAHMSQSVLTLRLFMHSTHCIQRIHALYGARAASRVFMLTATCDSTAVFGKAWTAFIALICARLARCSKLVLTA